MTHPKETKTKEVDVSKVNDAPETSTAVSDIPNTPTVQAQVAPEAKIDPVQPAPPSASDVAELVGLEPTTAVVDTDVEDPTLHVISDGDFENHPELKDQDVKKGDKVRFGKLWVYKYVTADRSSIMQEPWPRDTTGGKL